MPRARSVCSQPGCPHLTDRAGSCADCARQSEQRRGSAHRRGYGAAHTHSFREVVLARDPVCVICLIARSTVADHWPHNRRWLVAHGADPNDPRHGRGLCAPCHGRATAAHQPGGWNS